MSEDSVNNIGSGTEETSAKGGRKRQKIRIKYRERVRIKRTEGNKTIRYWKKNKKNIITAIIILTLFGYTIFMIGRIINERVKMNYDQKERNMEISF
jgi:hypothetical protein